MKRATIFALGVAAIASAAAAVTIYANWNAFVPTAAMGINYLRYLKAPKGELTVETAQGFDGANSVAAVRSPPPDDGLWPSYNKTLASDRFSSLKEINRENADRLKVLCTYDTHQYTGFNSGLLMVDGALLFATNMTPIPSTRSPAVKNGISMRPMRRDAASGQPRRRLSRRARVPRHAGRAGARL